MEEILQLKKTNCKNCHKCIRECPVKSIRFGDNQAHIIQDECILCGLCFVACPQNAKLIRNDVGVAKALIASGKRVVVSLAPSFVADFEVKSLKPMQDILQKLGFTDVEETAIGAQVVKKQYEALIAGQTMPIIISSCCHSINLLIQKYFPEVLPYLAPTLSPMLVHAALIKDADPDCYVVFIGPCISKKDEAQRYGQVDCVLTFDELREWLEEESLSIDSKADNTPDQKRSRSFPTTGGIIRSMDLDLEQFDYHSADGIDNCMAVLREIIDGNLTNCFIEMSACTGSCVGGPATRLPAKTPIANAGKVLKFSGRGNGEYEISGRVALEQDYRFIPLPTRRPGEKAIEEMLIKMGKTNPEDQLNCKSCGYNTCRDKAIAILAGKASISMCLPFLLKKAQSFSDAIIGNTPNAIIVMDEKLNIQQLNPAACNLFQVADSKELEGKSISSILGEIEYVHALESEQNTLQHKHYLPQFERYVDESIIFDKEYNVVISIMRDITQQELVTQEKERIKQHTAMITDKVIEKQMRVVQDIASLLGETTAETKIALTKLKDTLLK